MILYFWISDKFDSLLCILSQKNNTPSTISSHSTLFDLPFSCLYKLVVLNYKSVITVYTILHWGIKYFKGHPNISENYGPRGLNILLQFMHPTTTFITEALFCYTSAADVNECYSELAPYTLIA